MFVLNLVFWALLATATGQSGVPQYIQGQWMIPDENPQYEDTDGLVIEGRLWPESLPEDVELVTVEDQSLLTTQESYVLQEQGSDKEHKSAVWKVVLVAAILLVSIAGSVSMAYYLCVWRGGRIHYQPQKQDYA